MPEQGNPSPRVQPYVESGEWDEGSPVSIRFLIGNVCRGRAGSTNNRFCGIQALDCHTRAHEVSVWSGFVEGWYIPGGTSQHAGFYREPYLAPEVAGGPISQVAAFELQKQGDPVLLTVG